MNLLRVWRALTWLVPASCLIPIGMLVAQLPELAAGPPSDQWRQIGILFVVLAGRTVVVFLAAGVAAAIAALRGWHALALVLLAATWALALSGLSPLAPPGPLFGQLFVAPGIVAGTLTLLGLPLLRRGPILAIVAVVGLLAIPVATAATATIRQAQYFANDCPPGPSMDLTVSGPAAGHYTVACARPRSGTELTGCTARVVDVSFFNGQTVWSLSVPPAPAGVAVASSRPGASPSLVAGNDLYGGPYGWSGSYTFDTTCSGRIDLDLLGSSRTVRPVHVSGRFAAPRG